jgi:hypothetical protein
LVIGAEFGKEDHSLNPAAVIGRELKPLYVITDLTIDPLKVALKT